jgi:hypothetical protein
MDAAFSDTPSSRLIASAQSAPEVTDASGRRIALRRLTALDKLRLFKAAGPGLSQNQPWLGMAVLAASVAAMDDIPVPPPSSEAQIESLVSRLGDIGLAAIGTALAADAAPIDIAAHAGN